MFREMRTRIAVMGALGVAIITVVACWLALGEPGPAYKTRSLRYWVRAYAAGDNHAEAEEAIQKIGTNAFPLLLRWIREPEPRRHKLLVRIAEILPQALRPKWVYGSDMPRLHMAALPFRALGSKASPVIPELSALGANRTNAEVAGVALMALAYTGTNGIPALLSAARDTSHPHRRTAVYALASSHGIGPHSNLVVKKLISGLDDPVISRYAATTLGVLKLRPDLVVPALGRHLEQTNTASRSRVSAAVSLAAFGRQAAPYLTNGLSDPDPAVRLSVTSAINQIHSAPAARKPRPPR
jgi:hypothetical protein